MKGAPVSSGGELLIFTQLSMRKIKERIRENDCFFKEEIYGGLPIIKLWVYSLAGT